VSLNGSVCLLFHRYDWLLKYCEDHAWMAAGTSASSASSAVPTVPSVFTPPTSAGASTLTSTSVGADERAADGSAAHMHTLQARKLMPFSGSAELSDGSSVSLFSWLQRQLSALPETDTDTDTDHGARNGSSAPALEGHAFVETASKEGKVEVKLAKEAVKKKLSTECAGKIQNLLAKGEGIFHWQSEKD